MTKKILSSIFLLSFSLKLFCQTTASEYYVYPREQDAYIGGQEQFYKDFHQILIDKKLKPCENKNEVYYMKILVNEDASIKYVKDHTNTEMAAKNKCAYDLGLHVAGYLKKWNPVVIDGIKKQAVAGFFIIPDALFENYKEGYIPQADPASFQNMPDGINKFRGEVVKRIDLTGYKWDKGFQLVVDFVVNAEGNISDIHLEQSSGVKEFDNRIIDGIKSIRKKWSPAKVGGIPVSYRFRLPLSFGPM